jgi:hypothetical protein
MFDWKEKVQFLRENPRYSNAELFGVQIEPKENTNWAASVYHLTADENRYGHFIYIEVLCKQNDRDGTRGVLWGWKGMTREQENQIGAIFADKPENEIKSHPIYAGQHIWLEVAGGDRIENLHTVIDPDEATSDGHPGNSRFHHSYLVLFQEVDKSAPPPPDPQPDPDPPPTPEPEPTALVGSVLVTVNQAWVASLSPDSDGDVTFLVDVRSDE